jgi:hypothetical protein
MMAIAVVLQIGEGEMSYAQNKITYITLKARLHV